MLVPSMRTAPILTIDGDGATFDTSIVCSAELLPPSSSVTVRTMRYEPSSSGMKL